MSQQFDILIKGTKIIDGTGKPVFKGSLGIKGEKIVAVGNVRGNTARQIDGSGLVTCPGFIDIHAHGDVAILQFPLAESYIMQGITTTVGGNCGKSMAPIKDFLPFDIFSPNIIGGWWHRVEPHTYGPPYFPSIEKYGKKIEEKLGYNFDWRSSNEFLSKLEEVGISINYVHLVAHNAVRLAVMGEDFKRKAKPGEIEEMKAHVDEAMRSGAFGLGAGFDSSLGDFASIEEVIELAKVSQKYGGICACHTRNFDNNYPSTNPDEWGYGICHNISPEEIPVARYHGFLEAIEVSRKAEISTQIAHFCPAYTIYQYYPEILQEAAAKATLEIIDKARGEGLDVSFDVMPDEDPHGVILSQPSLIGIFSKWLITAGSKERLVENLKITGFRDELKKEIMGGRFKFIMIHPKTDSYWMDRLIILVCKNKEYEGKSIGTISCEKRNDPLDTLFDIIIEDPDTKFSCTDPRWTETTLRVLIKHPAAMIGSDVSLVPFSGPKSQGAVGLNVGEPGIGNYAFYPRYIRRFVKEKGILSLQEAVKKATFLPAQKLGLKDRGIIRQGAYADILVFDLENIRDKGTWMNPRVRPDGIINVIVNGKVVYENMTHTGVKSGRVLRHK